MAQKAYTSDNKEVCSDVRGWGVEEEGLILSSIIDWGLNRERGPTKEVS